MRVALLVAAIAAASVSITEAQTLSYAPAVQTKVLVSAVSPTELPRTQGRRSIEIYNRGPDVISCGFTLIGTTLTDGRPVDANGGSWALDNAPDTLHIWCIASGSSQVSSAATIVSELLR